MSQSPARRRYAWRLGAAMAAYLVTLLAADYLIEERGIAGPAAFAVSLVPALCVAAVFWALARLLVEERDEYRRMLLVRELLIGSGFTLTLVTIWGFWENFGLVQHFDGWYTAPLFFVGMGIGGVINKMTLGDAGGCP